MSKVTTLLDTQIDITKLYTLREDRVLRGQTSPPKILTGQQVIVEIEKIDAEIKRVTAELTKARGALVEKLKDAMREDEL